MEKVKIVNIYNDYVESKGTLKGGHGQAFYIEGKDIKVLFDVGLNGHDLLENMNILNLKPEEIEWIVISHGHYDHTYGLKALLATLPEDKTVKVVLHPNALESKKAKLTLLRYFSIKVPIGFPKLHSRLKEKMDLIITKEPFSINGWLTTTGEISIRTNRDGTAERMVHKEGRKWVKDPLLDDQSLLIHTNSGIIVLCGCCHAGVLNTLDHVRRLYPHSPIQAIIGGTHMLNFYGKDLEHVGDVLEQRYGLPELFLNHCTGQHVIDYFTERFGKDKVHLCYVGTELEFLLNS